MGRSLAESPAQGGTAAQYGSADSVIAPTRTISCAAAAAGLDQSAQAIFSEYFKPDEVRIITVNGADVGWIQVSEANREIHLDQLHLTEPFRDLGIGTKLIEHTMEKAKEATGGQSAEVWIHQCVYVRARDAEAALRGFLGDPRQVTEVESWRTQ